MKNFTYTASLAYILTFLIGAFSTAQAAPGTLSQQPLSLQTSVPPNIFFLNDDSGSMAWEILTTDLALSGTFNGTQPDGSSPEGTSAVHRGGCSFSPPGPGAFAGLYRYIVKPPGSPPFFDDCSVAADNSWRARSSSFNRLYFDPNKTYTPWPGPDYLNADIENARFDPTKPDTIDLTTSNSLNTGTLDGGFRFYTWVDGGDTDTIIYGNDGDIVTEYKIGTITDTKANTWGKTAAELKQNFANWFTYHRSRELVAKYALSLAIQGAGQARIGYGTINEENGIRINDPDTVDVDGGGDSTTHKEDVLEVLFNTESAVGGTPLKTGLMAAGHYYETGDLFGDGGTTSPILSEDEGGACQSNNTILMTDGFYNGNTSPGVGNADGGGSGEGDTAFDEGIYGDAFSNTLADVAMHYYERDLSDLPNDYPATDADPATHQHMNTYTLAFGLNGTIANPTMATITTDGFTWPEPSANDATSIDDLFHAAINGRGKYLSASNPDELVAALGELIGSITGKNQSANAVAASAFRLTDDARIFFTGFTSGSWIGELLAHSIDDDGISTTQEWNAATLLDGLGSPDTSRSIITYNNGGVAFKWDDNISEAMQTALTAGDTEDGIGEARLNYLRGETTNTFGFRERESILGDIVNSSPVFVGAPASTYPDIDPFGEDADGKRYYDFWDANKDRTKMIYVGANDGMLHGFNADTGVDKGKELIAYVPATVFPNLHELTDPAYDHLYYVDQTPTISDAFFALQGDGASDWHTVLVGGLGAGGRGLFALDITNPANFVESKADEVVLWEFNFNDDLDPEHPELGSDLGYTLSQPVVGMTEEGRWAVFVGNGYNSDSGLASLFIIYLDADPSDADGWNEGTDYLKISTGVGTAGEKNGLSSPAAVDSDGDGFIDHVYAGDLLGNMWVFDLSSSDNDEWKIAYGTSADPEPLFQAKNAANEIQPITVKPSVIRHPFHPTISSEDEEVNSRPNLMVLFGTGQYLTNADLDNPQTQTFYGVWDKGQPDLTRSNLVGQTITTGTDDDVTGTDASVTARITSSNSVPYGDTTSTERFGWYVDLDSVDASTGERVVSNSVVLNNTVFFSTYTPDSGECATGGSGWFMFLNTADGGHPSEPMISINNDLLVDLDDLVSLPGYEDTAPSGLRINTLGMPTLDFNGSVLLHTDDGVNRRGANMDGVTGKRISWRELRPE